MKKLIGIALAVVLASALMGCQSIGNGKLDIPEFSVGFVGADGTPYAVAYDEKTGLVIEGKYTSPKTGLVYEVTQDGGFVVSDPRTGLTVRLKETTDGQD